VAGSVFEIEQWIHDGTRVSELTLPLHGLPNYNWKRLENALTDVLLFVLSDVIRIVPVHSGEPLQEAPKDTAGIAPADSICLFSGGVDSLSGILSASEALRKIQGVFCAHSDQARIIKIVKHLDDAVLADKGIPIRKISVPRVGIRGYAQLRGFLYCVAAASWMHLTGARALIVTECGPTMYQPMFSPLDSVTMTTHPVVLHHAKIVIETLLQRPIKLITPFEDLTKAEVMTLCPRPDLIPLSHSCISQRFGTHDGTCYGCVIRRLAGVAAGVPDVTYARDPIMDEGASAGNLLSLLTFCEDILTSYSSMEPFEIEKIERYGKHDLFRRFALDQFAALHVLAQNRKPIRLAVSAIYRRVTEKLGAQTLESRLGYLRNAKPPADWKRSPPTAL
jgi:7-cyano-7-deazaguanine synthase in queuosine biosynthesis